MTEETTEPTAEPQKPATPEIDVDGMIAELEKAGVTDSQGVSNKLTAASQSGHLAQLLGDERQTRKNLEAQITELQKSASPQQEFDPYDQGQPVDLEAAVAKSVNRVLDERDKKDYQAQQRNLAEWNEIQSDPDYGLVKEVWESKLKDPNFVAGIQNGQVSASKAFDRTVREFHKGIMKRSLETINTLRGGGTTPVPHVETGERTPGNIVSDTPSDSQTATAKRRKELREKTNTGYQLTEQDELDIIDSLIMDSPIAGQPPK